MTSADGSSLPSCRRSLVHTGKFVKAGITTDRLDQIADDMTRSRGARSACVGYHGYPRPSASINDDLPRLAQKSDRLKDGASSALTSPFCTTFRWRHVGDVFVGNVSEDAKTLPSRIRCLHVGIKAARWGLHRGWLCDSKLVTRAGFGRKWAVTGSDAGSTKTHLFLHSVKGKGSLLYKWRPSRSTWSTKPRLKFEVKIPGSKVTGCDGRWRTFGAVRTHDPHHG